MIFYMTQSLFIFCSFFSFFGPGMAFWPEIRDPGLLKRAISQNIMQFGHFCILIFQNFENCNENLKFDTQSLFRIFQFYSFSGSRIAFWPENRDPDQIKHAISQNIMDFGDFCILIFQMFENCNKNLKNDTQSFDRFFPKQALLVGVLAGFKRTSDWVLHSRAQVVTKILAVAAVLRVLRNKNWLWLQSCGPPTHRSAATARFCTSKTIFPYKT